MAKQSSPLPAEEGAIFSSGKFGFNTGTAFSLGFGILDYIDARKEGRGVLQSAGSAAVNFVLPEIMGTAPYIAFEVAGALGNMGVQAIESANTQMRQMNRQMRNQQPFQGYTFVDSPQIYTMRQAGLALAQQSKYSLQQTMMGQEAKFMHR